MSESEAIAALEKKIAILEERSADLLMAVGYAVLALQCLPEEIASFSKHSFNFYVKKADNKVDDLLGITRAE